MSYIGNSPQQEIVLQLEQRKSFLLGLWLQDVNGRPLDTTDVTFTIVAKKPPFDAGDIDDSDNIIENSTAIHYEDSVGYVGFALQATDLNQPAGEYPYVITMLADGYSSVIVRGTIALEGNAEVLALTDSYSTGQPPTSLQVRMRGPQALIVQTGAVLAPNTTSFTDEDKEKLDGIETGARRHVPADWDAILDEDGAIHNKPAFGTAAYADVDDIAIPQDGNPGEVLMKINDTPDGYAWQVPPVGPGGGNLDATGVPAGQVPVAGGADSWSWDVLVVPVTSVNALTGDVELDLSNIPDAPDASRVAMLAAERDKLAALTTTPAWDDIDDKPTFGTAAYVDASEFLVPGGVDASDIVSGIIGIARLPKVGQMDGWLVGTTVPSGGADYDIYFQYAP